jgi:ornithine cyclodeaminase/alanine dehydrogenase-like protein (mu-crystallin family)
VVTLGSILAKAAPFAAERDPRALTIFKSCGVAFEDLAVASLAFRRARESALGVNFSFARSG